MYPILEKAWRVLTAIALMWLVWFTPCLVMLYVFLGLVFAAPVYMSNQAIVGSMLLLLGGCSMVSAFVSTVLGPMSVYLAGVDESIECGRYFFSREHAIDCLRQHRLFR